MTKMDIPSYVPDAVRSHAWHFLRHFENHLKGCEAKLAQTKEEMSHWQDSDCTELQRDELRQRSRDQEAFCKHLSDDIETIKRLVQDKRMKEVYEILGKAFINDNEQERARKLDGFIHSAWAARVDFLPFREKVERAKQLSKKIEKEAGKLAWLLREVDRTGINCPEEFYNIPQLLRQTDDHESSRHDKIAWLALRPLLLGDETVEPGPDSRPAQSGGGADGANGLEGKGPKVAPAEQARNTLRYGWGKAPLLPALLDTVEKAARHWVPGENEFIDAALKSRKKTPKTQYLRAFGNLLIDQHHFTLTAPLFKAMAVAATVVINKRDVVVTYDDVRKAMLQLTD